MARIISPCIRNAVFGSMPALAPIIGTVHHSVHAHHHRSVTILPALRELAGISASGRETRGACGDEQCANRGHPYELCVHVTLHIRSNDSSWLERTAPFE
jgi:hypothetical protein